jgi:hypothetical protein
LKYLTISLDQSLGANKRQPNEQPHSNEMPSQLIQQE